MPDPTAENREPVDLATALIELRHARAEIKRLRPFVDACDRLQRAAEEQPSSRYVVSDSTTWRALRDDQTRWAQILDWLRANGINPKDIPATSTLAIQRGPGGVEVIRHTAYVRADDDPYMGPLIAAPLVTEERAVPMTVPLPGRATADPSTTPAKEI